MRASTVAGEQQPEREWRVEPGPGHVVSARDPRTDPERKSDGSADGRDPADPEPAAVHRRDLLAVPIKALLVRLSNPEP